MSGISTNYRELLQTEIHEIGAAYDAAWKHPDIPSRQYKACVMRELSEFCASYPLAPFDALVSCLRAAKLDQNAMLNLLDVGCSSGYYKEVMRVAGYEFQYLGLDYSPAFKHMAEQLFPGIEIEVADARSIPHENDAFDIVLSGACIMHVNEYAQVISELARVSSRFVILHRTPFVTQGLTQAFVKEAYGVRCLEWRFAESELLELFTKNNLELLHTADIFWDTTERYGHRTYLLRKFEFDRC